MSTITAKLIQLNQERLDFIQHLNTKKINVATTSTFTELVNLLDVTPLFDVTDATVTPETLNKNKTIYDASGNLIQGTLQMPNTFMETAVSDSKLLNYFHIDKQVLNNSNTQIINARSINEIDATAITELKQYSKFMYENDSEHLPDFVDLGNCKSYPTFDSWNPFIADSCWKNHNLPFFNTVYLTNFDRVVCGNHSGSASTSGFVSPLHTIGGFAADSCIKVGTWWQVSIFTHYNNVTYFGGFKNLGKAYDPTKPAHYEDYTFDAIPDNDWNLSKQSILDILNWLYDIASKGCARQLIKIGPKYINMLTADELAIATQKGWDVE